MRQRRPPTLENAHNSKEAIMTPVLQFLASAFFVFSLLAAPASAEEVKAGDLVITQAWSRATPGGAKSRAAISPSRTRVLRRIG
jgi:hypothetical protein